MTTVPTIASPTADFGFTDAVTTDELAMVAGWAWGVRLWPRQQRDCDPHKRWRDFTWREDGSVREIVRGCRGRPTWRCFHGQDRVHHYAAGGEPWLGQRDRYHVALYRTGDGKERQRRRKRITQRAKAVGAAGYRVELDVGLTVVICTHQLDGGEWGRTVPTEGAWMVVGGAEARRLWWTLLSWPSPIARKPQPFGGAPTLDEPEFERVAMVLFENSPRPGSGKRDFMWDRMAELGFDVDGLTAQGLPAEGREPAQAAWAQVAGEWAERVAPMDVADWTGADRD